MKHRPIHRRGSALTLAIVMAIVLTGLICVLAWVTGEQTQRTRGLKKVDQAFFAAEAGAQRVQWYCKTRKLSLLTQPLTGSLNGYNYSVTWNTVVGTTITVRAVGTAGSVSYLLSERMTPPFNAPALAAGGTFDNKNIDIVGDIIANSYNNAGTGSLNGNLIYSTTATGTSAVTGTVTCDPTAFLPIDFDSLGATLIAAAGLSLTGDQINATFDFTSLPGTRPVIYVNGNVTNPTFIGSGTLYATGTVSVNNAGSFTNPVNIVCRGDITTENNDVIFGSIYSRGNWHRGKFTLTGIAYIAKDVDSSNFAQSTLTASSPAWFDPRTSSWNPLTSVANFSGPQP
jgi:hypothetical protein